MIAEPRRTGTTGGTAAAPGRLAADAPAALPTPATVLPEQRGPLFVPPFPQTESQPGPRIGPRIGSSVRRSSSRTPGGVVGGAALVLLAIAAAVSYAVHTSPGAGASGDAAYLSTVRSDSLLSGSDATDAVLIALGHSVCATLDRYPSRTGVIGAVIDVRRDTGWTRADSGAVVASAVGAYCPAHVGVLRS